MLANGEDVILAKWVDIIRIARNLQLTHNFRIGRIGQVQCEQRINLHKSDKIAAGFDKTGCIDFFARGNILKSADDLQFTVIRLEAEQVIAQLRGIVPYVFYIYLAPE